MSNNHRLLDALLLVFRPARWSICGFRFVPLLLLAAGTWAVVYGGFYHRIPVSETHEEQISIAVPVERPMPPPMPPGAPPDAVGFPPPEAFAPPVKFIQAVKTTKTTSAEWELAVNRAVTVAGMIRDQQGEIVRVSGAAEGPAFCPS
ncbi:MAG: hypothetical protein ACLP9L_13570 [Thermoguttaceae bacterium]